MIEIRNLTKDFHPGRALSGIGFIVPPGKVCGLIGANGAGKTTLLRILATLIPPSSGVARICDFDVVRQAWSVRRRIGYMPDTFAGYDEMRADAYLEMFARIHRLPPRSISRNVDDILALVDLTDFRNHRIASLSLGARQRLALGRVLLHNAEVLLLDEPVTGLDPMARIEMRALLKELGRMGKTVLISSHILPDLADLCDQLVVIDKGRLVFDGSLADLRHRVEPQRCVEVVSDSPRDAVLDLLRRQDWAGEVRATDRCVEVLLSRADVGPADVGAALFAEGYRVIRLGEKDMELEEAFLRIIQEGGAGRKDGSR
jgi:ABC-2 type transport system ATP-binding protein